MGTWGRQPECKCGRCDRCRSAAHARQSYREMTPEQRREWRGRRRAERVREADRRRYHDRIKKNPEEMQKRRARWTLNNAIRDGRVVRGDCEDCGAPRAHAHHDDYDRPFDVRWLCPGCHAAEHNPEARAA